MLKSLFYSGCPTHNTGTGNTPMSDTTTDEGGQRIHPDFLSHGLSSVDITADVLIGRPYGGTYPVVLK